MNHSDSERIDAFMQKNGFSKPKINDEEKLTPETLKNIDIFIINTCGIRQMAEDRVFGLIKNLRKNNPKIKIVITGCLADRKDIHKRMKDVNLFTAIKNFPKDVSGIIHNTKNLSKENIDYLSIRPKHNNSFQAYVPIMTGCNNFCSYCVVPYARGREISRPADEIIDEIKNLIKNDCKHIILLGQNVNSYASKVYKVSKVRKEKIEEINFSKLLKMIDKIPGKFWISFVSSHPKDVNDEMIETVARCKKVCENFHLPIQSGNNSILEKMNRKYSAKDYLKITKKIKIAFKKHKPDLPFAITSDIIVGFPGETKKQLEDSAKVMREVKFDMVFFGQFSPRPGTAAWKMKDNVSKKEKESRMKYLNEILKKTTLANNKQYLGKKLNVLIEQQKDDFYFGKTRSGKNVKITSNKKDLIGKIIKVRITRISTWNLEGISF